MIFGGGYFDDVFGELTAVEMGAEGVPVTRTDEAQMEVVEKLAHSLIIKLEPYVNGGMGEGTSITRTNSLSLYCCLSFTPPGFEVVTQFDLDQKLEAPGGAALLKLIGHIYTEVRALPVFRFLSLSVSCIIFFSFFVRM